MLFATKADLLPARVWSELSTLTVCLIRSLGRSRWTAAGHSGRGDLKRGPQETLDVFGLAELIAPLGDPLEDPVYVEFVPEVPSQAKRVQVARENDERDRVPLGDVGPQDGVGDAGPDVEQRAQPGFPVTRE